MPDREKREKVIEGLKRRLECGCMNEDHCNPECPYLEDSRACYGLDEDALALLQAQEPRVMTLEEVKSLHPHEDVYIERISCVTGLKFVHAATVWRIFSNCFEIYPDNATLFLSDYSEKWCCWTSRPTDAQREGSG